MYWALRSTCCRMSMCAWCQKHSPPARYSARAPGHILSTPQRHDELAALLSHLPHLMASILSDQVGSRGEDMELLRILAGSGLRDTTRFAKGDAGLWRQIALQNREPLADLLEESATRLGEMAALLRAGNAAEIEAILERGAACRCRLERRDCTNGYS